MVCLLIAGCQRETGKKTPGGVAGVIKVVVWDERQSEQKEAYPNFVGNHIADYLNTRPNLSVQSVGLDDPEQGVTKEILDNCDVLVWWGHIRQDEISIEKGQEIVNRIKEGKLSLIALHASHWATPFVEAMNERTKMNVRKMFPTSSDDIIEFEFIRPAERFTPPKKDTQITPYVYPRKFPDGVTRVFVDLPNCCFPGYRPDGKPSFIKTLKTDHPIAEGVPETFVIPNTEMYDEPFHVPEPDEVIFEERWEPGEWFRAGMVWNMGKGKVFYFRPGHETYKVYFEAIPLKIVENAIRWLVS